MQYAGSAGYLTWNFMTDLINEGSVSYMGAGYPACSTALHFHGRSIIEFPDEADWTSVPRPEVAEGEDPLSAYTEYLLSSP